MKLSELISPLDVQAQLGSTEVEVQALHLDSRAVGPGSLFAAIRGAQMDGHHFIAAAVAAGASVILCEEMPDQPGPATYIQVDDSAKALGLLAANFYGNPSASMTVVGITGTNGKTSVGTMLYEVFRDLGHKVGLLSTIRYVINGEEFPSTHTTPHAIRIQELLATMRDAGCTHVFMEVSSHAIDQQRIAGLQFAGAVFTNITHDHLDYHKDFRSYLYTKKRLFDALDPDAFALYNKDDRNGQVMVQNCRAPRYSFSLKSVSDFKTRIVEHDLAGMQLELGGDELWVRLVGAFNAYNVLAVYATAFLLGHEHMEILKAISQVRSVEGRFEHIRHAGITAIVDYAHTPDALQNVLDTVQTIRSGNEQLICVLGCGGDRDKAKRPIMAQIASSQATRAIFTSDNPRTEDPTRILDDMMSGVEGQHYKKVLRIPDREEAIKTAISLSKPGDVILVAGKGHEKYQEIHGVRHPFDDKEVLQRNLKLIHN